MTKDTKSNDTKSNDTKSNDTKYKDTEIFFNKVLIKYTYIELFYPSKKEDNDMINKIRENIIMALISKNIPTNWLNNKWEHLNNNLFITLHQLDNNINKDTIIKIIPKGGRTYNYDFQLIVNEKIYNIEFKFNASTINEAPQFNSPHNPSKYMSQSYEEFYYDYYVQFLFEKANLSIPDKKTYVKEIGQPNPPCVLELKHMAKNNKEIREFANQLAKESINIFIQNTELDIEKLSNYLLQSQTNKTYLLYKDGKFYIDLPNLQHYKLLKYMKLSPNFIATTEEDHLIEIMLRWKNGNGIAYPAFQIKEITYDVLQKRLVKR